MNTLPAIPATGNAKERLSTCVAILTMIDRRREQTNDPGLGGSIERQIIERELRELELDIAASPAELELQPLKRPRSMRAAFNQ